MFRILDYGQLFSIPSAAGASKPIAAMSPRWRMRVAGAVIARRIGVRRRSARCRRTSMFAANSPTVGRDFTIKRSDRDDSFPAYLLLSGGWQKLHPALALLPKK